MLLMMAGGVGENIGDTLVGDGGSIGGSVSDGRRSTVVKNRAKIQVLVR